MITIRDLEFHYDHGDFSLAIRELDIETGSAVAVIGPSGCGKTTFLNLLSGIALPSSGRISVNETEPSRLSDRARRRFRITNIGFVFQDFGLIEYLSVLDNIVHPYRLNPVLRLSNDVRKRACELAEAMGIGGKLADLPGELSHGEKQRAAICRAMVTSPRLMLADEPTGNLDPKVKARVVDLLLGYVREHGATLVMVTHDHSLIGGFDHVIDFETFYTGDRYAE